VLNVEYLVNFGDVGMSIAPLQERILHLQVSPVRAISVAREYGSGGGEFAAHLAQELDWQLFDHHIVAQIADALDESESDAARRDEHICGFFTKVLDNFSWSVPQTCTAERPKRLEDIEKAHHDVLCRLVNAAVQIGNVVIVGRGSQALLADRPDVLRVRVVAPLEQRIANIARRENVSLERAERMVKGVDRQRLRYLKRVEHCDPNDLHLYDLIINTGMISVEDAVDMAVTALQSKAERLFDPKRCTSAEGQSCCAGKVQELWIRKF
jgi:cytidylate kinase